MIFLKITDIDGDFMNPLKIHNNSSEDVTIVSNHFLDLYMPKANGEFVKIYLYLLRMISSADCSLTLSSIADTFDCTENDVERALRYWDKKDVLRLTIGTANQITGLTLLPFSEQTDSGISAVSEKETASPVYSQPETEPAPAAYSLTPDRVKELKKNEEVMQLLFIAEQYLGKTLSPTETTRILYFYEELHFSADLIEYLIEYCVSKGSKSIRYMEKVALAWAQSGITTVKMAKQETNTFSKHYFSVMKAFGITGRNPVESEIQMIDRWMKDYSFTTDIILEACARTINQTGKPSFQYADGILGAWHKKGVLSFSDIQELDVRHKESRERTAPRIQNKTSNKFNNFHQRDYNFSDLEKQLLKK
ncbi:DnaD domain protein [Ruminococcus sp. OA3]|uniref:DnaD domain protein n=1 Tax=Ruminococcus sp. OA3 TaxID=2914164 RepID=UPI001F06CA2D|nr:DnaD domain protein [Ruminococcus sp. OA3]MCH1984431.1 DnaD domain protein [Ruminococcus sp. OA3]